MSTNPTAPVATAAVAVDPAEVAELRQQIAQLRTELEQLRQAHQQTVQRLGQLQVPTAADIAAEASLPAAIAAALERVRPQFPQDVAQALQAGPTFLDTLVGRIVRNAEFRDIVRNPAAPAAPGTATVTATPPAPSPGPTPNPTTPNWRERLMARMRAFGWSVLKWVVLPAACIALLLFTFMIGGWRADKPKPDTDVQAGKQAEGDGKDPNEARKDETPLGVDPKIHKAVLAGKAALVTGNAVDAEKALKQLEALDQEAYQSHDYAYAYNTRGDLKKLLKDLRGASKDYFHAAKLPSKR